jgi:hypothetical protein
MSEINLEATRATGLCPTCGNEHCICGYEVEPLPPLRERVEQEKAEKVERVERLAAHVERLFPGEASAPLRQAIVQSFEVPQWGKFHNEGMYMDTHLDKILSTIDEIYEGRFPKGASDELKAMLKQATEMTDKDSFQRYAFLHDLEKRSTLKLKRADGSEQDVTWDEWQGLLPGDLAEHPDPVALERFLAQSDIEGISYYHDEQKHGDAGADAIVGIGIEIDSAVLTAIRKHEVGFLFSGIQTKIYEEHFGDLSEEEKIWAITASYTDTMASYQTTDPSSEPSAPDTRALDFLIESKKNYDTIQDLVAMLEADDDVKAWKQAGLKEATIEGDVNVLKGKKEKLSLAKDLFAELKEKYAPKLIPGPLVGKMMGQLLKPMGLGSEMGNARNALIGLKEGADVDAVYLALESVAIEQASKDAIVAWLKENQLV